MLKYSMQFRYKSFTVCHMTYKQLIKQFGGAAKIRERFGFSKQRMNNWRVQNRVPKGALVEIELTKLRDLQKSDARATP